MKQTWHARQLFWQMAVLLSVTLAAAQAQADSSTLWRIIDTQCVPHQLQNGSAAPCAKVDLAPDRAHGYVVLKDLVGSLQYLVMPTVHISGIESPELLDTGARNYWEEAWAARSFMEERYGASIPRQDVALAINSVYGRSQNQMHIHVSCVDPDVLLQVEAVKDRVPAGHWELLPTRLKGHSYLAMRVDALPGDRLGLNPFLMMTEGIPHAVSDMGRYTLGMVAVEFAGHRDGFILLAGRAAAMQADRGHAEELQDHACSILPGRTETPAVTK